MQKRQNFQTISWFYDIYNRNLLNLDPPYQRKSVWNQAFKDYFVDTILLNYPAPAIFLYEDINREGIAKYNVVDGKQRLTTLFKFIKGEYPVSDLAVISELRGKYFDELSSDVINRIWSYTFSVEYLPTTDENIINNIFDRVNRNVARLTSQELRHARFSGLFITTAEDLTEWTFEIFPRNFPRIGSQSKKQMKDVELVAQLMLMIEEGPKGYSIEELDKAFSDRDSEWENKDIVIQKYKETINSIKMITGNDPDNFLLRSRFQNQADFFSVFGAVSELNNIGKSPDSISILDKIKSFTGILENEDQRSNNKTVEQYYEYVRTASNRTTARKERIRILKDFILS